MASEVIVRLEDSSRRFLFTNLRKTLTMIQSCDKQAIFLVLVTKLIINH